jgi:hypothetical protein
MASVLCKSIVMVGSRKAVTIGLQRRDTRASAAGYVRNNQIGDGCDWDYNNHGDQRAAARAPRTRYPVGVCAG